MSKQCVYIWPKMDSTAGILHCCFCLDSLDSDREKINGWKQAIVGKHERIAELSICQQSITPQWCQKKKKKKYVLIVVEPCWTDAPFSTIFEKFKLTRHTNISAFTLSLWETSRSENTIVCEPMKTWPSNSNGCVQTQQKSLHLAGKE